MALTSSTLPVETLEGAVDVSLADRLRQVVQNQTQHPLEKATVSVAGLGPIQLGMTIAEASQATGVEFAIAPGDRAQVCQYYLPTNGIDGLGLMAIEGRIIRIDIWPGSPIQTVSGARIGTTEAQLEALYPGQIEVLLRADGKYLTYTSNEDGRNLYRIVFETSPEGRVTQYRTGQFPAVTWLEGCS
ncbi:MAG: hypothetical protein AAFU71_08285 [Cyanobacteria bacterium J06632_22]